MDICKTITNFPSIEWITKNRIKTKRTWWTRAIENEWGGFRAVESTLMQVKWIETLYYFLVIYPIFIFVIICCYISLSQNVKLGN